VEDEEWRQGRWGETKGEGKAFPERRERRRG
jgi:hypothetical protein